MNKRLSSDHLYHFTKSPETISKIINNGFRFSLCDESITFKSLSKNLFNISFCDIRFEESENHRKCYGDNSIVLSKKWGIKNGISPVRYIHKNSPGLSESYILQRKNFHLLQGISRTPQQIIEFELLYLFTSLREFEQDSRSIDFDKELKKNQNGFISEYNKRLNEYANFYNILKSRNEKNAELFLKYIRSLIDKITELHNELIERDNFMRLYEDNFKCPIQEKTVQRLLYDEREWRAIHLEEIDDNERGEQISLISSYLKQGYLPPKYNLRFTEKDVVAIIAKDQKAKKIILEETQPETCPLSKEFIEDRIYTIKDFNEI